MQYYWRLLLTSEFFIVLIYLAKKPYDYGIKLINWWKYCKCEIYKSFCFSWSTWGANWSIHWIKFYFFAYFILVRLSSSFTKVDSLWNLLYKQWNKTFWELWHIILQMLYQILLMYFISSLVLVLELCSNCSLLTILGHTTMWFWRTWRLVGRLYNYPQIYLILQLEGEQL